METKGPLKTFDVYPCHVPGRKIAGTSRRADNVTWVAIERGPFDPRREPEGEYKSVHYRGNFPAYSKQDAINDAINEARLGRSPRAGGRRK